MIFSRRRVYLVGVSGRRTRGSYGVAVTPDIGLDEALGLVQEAALVIIPCGEDALHVFHRDPRFDVLLVQAEKSGARIRILAVARNDTKKLLRVPLFQEKE